MAADSNRKPTVATFEELREIQHERLLERMLRSDEDDKRFAPVGTAATVLKPTVLRKLFESVVAASRITSSGLTSDDFVHRVQERGLHTFLAVLIFSNCTVDAVGAFIAKLVAPPHWPVAGSAGRDLSRLPLTRDEAYALLGTRVAADLFVRHQVYFCTVVLKQKKEVQYPKDFRLPYLREEPIGEGSFGKVYKVLIASDHFVNDAAGMSNPQPREMARKDYELAQTTTDSLEKERRVMRELLRNSKRSRNILENLGSLQMDNTYSLFMPLAYCDLWEYMMERHPNGPDTLVDKAKVIQRAAGLASGLAFLHEELVTDDFERLCCFHMDLKPRNILVFRDGDGLERWTLSDFNMSRVKVKEKVAADSHAIVQRSRSFLQTADEYDFNKLFVSNRNRSLLDPSQATATLNKRGDGTYLAPEPNMRAEGDTWSLGCVLAVVFSYLDGGAESIIEFGHKRSTVPANRRDDKFFSLPAGSKPLRLSEGVETWFKELRLRAMKRLPAEGLIVKDFLQYLEKHVLLVNQEKRRRTTAKNVELRLAEIYRRYSSIELASQPSPTLQRERRRSLFSRLHIRAPKSKPSNSDPDRWKLQVPPHAKGCTFSSNAEALAYWTEDILVVYSVMAICQTHDVEDLIVVGKDRPGVDGGAWKSVAVSSNYVIASTSRPVFDCRLYSITDTSSHGAKLDHRASVSLKLPQITKVAISPDSEYVACLLQSTSEKEPGFLYISRLTDLLNEPDGRITASSYRYSIASSLTNSSSSSGFSEPVIRLPCPARDITDLLFSETNSIFIVIEPEQSASMREHKVTIMAWQLPTQRLLSPIDIVDDGHDDTLESLFTSFSPFHNGDICAVISQEKFVIVHSLSSDHYVQERVEGYRLLKAMMSLNDEKIYCTGTKEATHELRLLRFETPVLPQDVSVEVVSKLPGMTDLTKYTASLFKPEGTDDARILIATLEGYVYQVNLT